MASLFAPSSVGILPVFFDPLSRLKFAAAFSDVQRILSFVAAHVKNAELKSFAADANWKHLMTALFACGYEDGEVQCFLKDAHRLGPQAFLACTPSRVNFRCYAKLVFLLHILVDLGLLEQQAPSVAAVVANATPGFLDAPGAASSGDAHAAPGEPLDAHAADSIIPPQHLDPPGDDAGTDTRPGDPRRSSSFVYNGFVMVLNEAQRDRQHLIDRCYFRVLVSGPHIRTSYIIPWVQ